jgi:thioesterase domain-containing protein
MTKSARQTISPLIPIQLARPGSPSVVCIPGAGASVTCFLPLADSLGRDVSVYGMQTRGLDGNTAPHPTVESAALEYLEWLELSPLGGSYQLLGHSFGGWIAFEMACHLTLAGMNLNRLLLLDTEPPCSPDFEPQPHTRVEVLLELIDSLEQASGKCLRLSRADLERLDEEAQLQQLSRAIEANGAFSTAPGVSAVFHLVSVFERNMNTRYVPTRRFPGQITLVHPASSPSNEKTRAQHANGDGELPPVLALRAWQAHAAAVRGLEVAGNHMSMLERPGIVRVARELSLGQ